MPRGPWRAASGILHHGMGRVTAWTVLFRERPAGPPRSGRSSGTSVAMLRPVPRPWQLRETPRSDIYRFRVPPAHRVALPPAPFVNASYAATSPNTSPNAQGLLLSPRRGRHEGCALTANKRPGPRKPREGEADGGLCGRQFPDVEDLAAAHG